MAKRIKNWDKHLIRWAESTKGKDFVWGETDCASLISKALGVMYHRKIFDYNYTNMKSAKETLDDIGDVGEKFISVGAELKPWSYATAGDIFIGEQDHGFPTMHVVLRGKCLSSRIDSGVIMFNKSIINSKTVELYKFPYEVEV